MKPGETEFLYLTTTGRRTGQPREIEIWFTEHAGRYYVIAEYGTAQWVRNIANNPDVSFRVGEATFRGRARVINEQADPVLHRYVQYLSREKYGWGDGVVVELLLEAEPSNWK